MSAWDILPWVFVVFLVCALIANLGVALAIYQLRKMLNYAYMYQDGEMRRYVLDAIAEIAGGKYGR